MTWSPGQIAHWESSDHRRSGQWMCTEKVVRDIVPGRTPARRVGLSVFVAKEAAAGVMPIWPDQQAAIDNIVGFRAWQVWHLRRAWPLVRNARRLKGAP